MNIAKQTQPVKLIRVLIVVGALAGIIEARQEDPFVVFYVSAILLFVLICWANCFFDRLEWMICLLPIAFLPFNVSTISVTALDLIIAFLVIERWISIRLDKTEFGTFGVLALLLLISVTLSFLLSQVSASYSGFYLRFVVTMSFIIGLDSIVFPFNSIFRCTRALAISVPAFFLVLFINGELFEIVRCVFIDNERPNYSQWLPLYFTFFLVYLIKSDEKFRSIGYVGIVFYILSVFKGQSQIMTLIACIVVLFVIVEKMSFSFKVTIIGFLLSTILLFMPFVTNFFKPFVDENRQMSNELRIYKMEQSIMLFYKNPILGGGIGSETKKDDLGLYEGRTEGQGASENTFVQCLAENGAIGFGIFICIVFFILHQFFKLKKKYRIFSKELSVPFLLFLCALGPMLWGGALYSAFIWILLFLVNLTASSCLNSPHIRKVVVSNLVAKPVESNYIEI